MKARRLRRALLTAFPDSTPGERHVVARQARDLASSGKPEADRGHELTAQGVVDHLLDAPDDCSLAERWNWWMGALEVAYGGYREFLVQVVPDGDPAHRTDEDLSP
ncbi:MAG: hypothetical protein ABEJ74_02760 [Haloferacaceae archaeon]